MAVDLSQIPVRMCIAVQLENGLWQAYCIACHWSGTELRTKEAAERSARRHTCRKRGDATK